jgi:tetratricopeptide (TPR) repeat protein
MVRNKNISMVFLVFLLSLSLTLTLFGQQGRGKGRIRGTVQDEAGNPIEGAKIVAQHLRYDTKFESESDDKGHWAVAGLGTGFFRITVSKEGYGTTYHEMNISQFSSKNPPLEFTLKKIQTTGVNMPAIQDEEAIPIFEEGNELYEQKKYSEAVEKYKEFLERNPTIYQVNINIGSCYQEMGEYDKAIEAYNEILNKVKEEKGSYEGDESAARALISLGECYIKKGDLEKAREYLKQAIDIFPGDETIPFNIGEIYFNQGETDKAIEYFKLAIQVKESWAAPYQKLGYAYLNKGEYKLAIESLKKFLELAPDDPQTETIQNLILKLEELIKKQ